MASTSNLSDRYSGSVDDSHFSFFVTGDESEPLPEEPSTDCPLDGSEPTGSFRSLFTFTTRAHIIPLVLAVLASVSAGLLQPVSGIFFGLIFSALTKFGAGLKNGEDTLREVSTWCWALVGSGGAAWAVEGLLVSAWMIFGERQSQTVRELLFQGLLENDAGWYDLQKDGIGSLLSRIQTQVRELQLAISQPLGFLLFETVGAIAALATAFYFSWRLTLVIIAVFPVAVMILSFISMRIGPAIEAQKRELTSASKSANTSIIAIDTVKTLNGQSEELWKYRVAIETAASHYLVQAKANAFQFGVTKFTLVGIFVQGFWYGIYLSGGGVDPGHIVTTFYACLAAVQAMETLLPQWLVLKKGMSAGRTLRLLHQDLQSCSQPLTDAETLRPFTCEGDVEIKNIHFAYPINRERVVLYGASFKFSAGELMFVVGKSGSGKSTLANLLLKIYEAQEGSIAVDRQSISRLDTSWLRQNVTLVQQRSVLLNDTLRNNIKFGSRKDFKKESWRLEEACNAAGLWQVTRTLDDGLDTVMGHTGRSLSGGQMQRVAMARAFLRNSPILILDEATSALDPSSREEIMENIRWLRRHKTTIIITHDVSQIEMDHFVYVLEAGSVVQEGYCHDLEDMYHGTFAMLRRASTNSEDDCTKKHLGLEPVPPTQEQISPDEELQGSSRRWTNFSNVLRKSHRRSSTSSSIFTVQSPRMSIGFATIQANALYPNNIVGPLHGTGMDKEDCEMAQGISQPQIPFLSPRTAPEPPIQVRRIGGIEIETKAIMLDDLRPRSFQVGRSEYGTSLHCAGIKRNLSTCLSARLRKLRKPKHATDFKPATLAQIFSTVWPALSLRERCVLVCGFVAALIVACATPAFATILARLLNVFYMTTNQAAEARKWALSLLATAIIDATAVYWTHYCLEYCGQAWVNALRIDALRRILNQPKSWFDEEKNSANRLTECLDRNAEEMRNLLGRFAGPVYTVFFMLGISVIWALTISWKLTLTTLACSPIMYAIMRTFHLVSSSWEEKSDHASSVAHDIFTEAFSNITFVRSLTLESHFKNKYATAIAKAFSIGRCRAMYSGILYGLNDSSTFYTAALIFYSGARMISFGSESVTSIINVMNLLLFGIANASCLLSVMTQISSAKVTAAHMLYLINLPERSSYETGGLRRISTPFPIHFNDLNFSYPSQSQVRSLQNINLAIFPGTITAVVGPSGCGKSTLVSLLLGLYSPDPAPPFSTPPYNSPLTFAGMASQSIHLPSLRNLITLVPQSPALFPTSIFQNIVYGLPSSSPCNTTSAATRAARAAGIHDFIVSLDCGYATPIGDGGMGLSGGQTQRLAIARALVRRPKLLILDEATSALDAGAAEGIRGVVKRLVEASLMEVERGEAEEAMSVLVISHSVEMMRIADEVVVIEGGKVAEHGEFNELRRERGALRRLIGSGTERKESR